jgi:hypothetical protein
VDSVDHRVDVVLVEELDPVGRLAVVRASELVAGPADELHHLFFVTHHRVRPRLIGADDSDGEVGAGLLGCDLGKLKHLERVVRGLLVQVDPAHAVQDVRDEFVAVADLGKLQRTLEVVARRVGEPGYLAATMVYTGRGNLWFFVAAASALAAPLMATRIPLVARVVADPSTTARLALPHTLRVLGVVFLVLMTLGHLPAVFAVPAGLGDIAIGVAAPIVYRRLARRTGHRAAVRFNLLGILDLLVAASIATLVSSGLLDVTPSTEPLRLLPLALIPTAAVPLAVALHIVSLHQLHTAAAGRPSSQL